MKEGFKVTGIPEGVSLSFYVPGTDTLGTVYDSSDIVLEQPVLFDIAGEAIVYFHGQYDVVIGGTGSAADLTWNSGQAMSFPRQTGVDLSIVEKELSAGAKYPGPQIISNDGTTIVISSQTWNLFDNSNHSGICKPYVVAEASFNPPVGVSYIVADYNAGSPEYRLTTNVNEINESSICPALSLTNDGSVIHVINWDSLGSGQSNKIHRWIVKNFRFRNQSGNAISEDGSRHIIISSGLSNIGAAEIMTQEVNTINATLDSTGPTLFYEWTKTGPNNTDWIFSFVKQYDNQNYNPEAGGLTPLLPQKYVVLWFYRDIDVEPHAAYVRGKNAYSTLAEAKTAQPRNDLPPAFSVNGILVGRIILVAGASSGIVESAFSTTFVGSPVTDHESLAGLLGGVAGQHYHLTEEQHTTAENIYVDAKDPTGFVNPEAVVVTGDSVTRNCTLTGDLGYYFNGIKKELNSPFTPDVPHTDGADGESRYLYSVDGENFLWSSVLWVFYHVQACRAVRVNGTWYYFREPHGTMPWLSHDWSHRNGGAYRSSGGSAIAGSYALNTDGNAAVTPNFSEAVLKDEDNPTTIAQVNAGGYAHAYFSGSRLLRFNVDQALPYRVGNTYPLINVPTAGVFADVETVTARYFNVYQLLTPAAADASSQKVRMQFLQPQTTFATQAAAEAENPFNLDALGFGGFGLEQVILTRMTFGTSAAYTATGRVRLLSMAEVTSKLNINGLGAAATTAENVITTPSGNLTSTNQADTNAELDALKVNLDNYIDWANPIAVTGTTTLTIGKYHICTGTTADYTVTLPPASGNAGKLIAISMSPALTKWVTVDGNASELIDLALNRKMHNREFAILECDGVGWTKIAGTPIPVFSSVKKGVAQTGIAEGIVTKITVDTVISDANSIFDQANSNIVLPRTGLYTIRCFSNLNQVSKIDNMTIYARNGTTNIDNLPAYAHAATFIGPQLIVDYQGTAGDTINMALFWSDATLSANQETFASAPRLSVTEKPTW